jgi:beta-glucosidase
MDKSLSPDVRADLVIQRMTLDEKIQLVHGTGWGVMEDTGSAPPRANLGVGFVPGIDHLGIPDINLADSAVGVRMAARQSRYATLLPSTLGLASSWDPDAAQLYGSVIGRELRAQGFNMSIGGGVNIAREPRNGRNFEYAGEDPVLAGTMVGNLMKGLQAQKIMGDIKHYALNDQETGRGVVNGKIDKRSMWESDLLAFQIAIGIAHPAGVMCSYNRINGDYACENEYTLQHVLKGDFGFKGWVLSDWDGTHSTVKAAIAGLDMEMPSGNYFGPALRGAVEEGTVPVGRLNDMVHRILRSMFEVGVIDYPPMPRSVVDPFRGRDNAQHIAEESIVLLKNSRNTLPLTSSIESIAVIGSHADVGVLSGGGSAQVDSPGGNAAVPESGISRDTDPVYFPSSPQESIQERAPNAQVKYADGTDVAAAVKLAQISQVAIVFVNQPMSEGRDAETSSLPDNQDALVSAVAAANPNTIVVLETGGPVTMPWSVDVAGIIEAWYPGIGGGQALANILFGVVNPSAKLAVTFARSDADLPRPKVTGFNLPENVPFDVNYAEGAKVGYKWFEAEHKQPLFPFGFGTSYTSYAYSDLNIDERARTVGFKVKNVGARSGTEIAQVYVELPGSAGEPFKRLVGWKRVALAPGESKEAVVDLDPLYLSIFDAETNHWNLSKGKYRVLVGGSSETTPLSGSLQVN